MHPTTIGRYQARLLVDIIVPVDPIKARAPSRHVPSVYRRSENDANHDQNEPTLSNKFSLPTENPFPIAMIGCGGITAHHLSAYRDAGWEVSALCDLDLDRAKARRDQFFPKARIYQDYQKLLASEEAPILDVTTHPEERVAILRDCIEARRHILSQKPFTTDLSIGQELCDLADRYGVTLAVNQNGRFSPISTPLERRSSRARSEFPSQLTFPFTGITPGWQGPLSNRSSI